MRGPSSSETRTRQVLKIFWMNRLFAPINVCRESLQTLPEFLRQRAKEDAMKKSLRILLVTTLIAPLLALSGCRDMFAASCDQCGVIQSITPQTVRGESSGGGAVAGAIIGGVIGHQFGSGRGQDVATAGGAVGGAIAGNEIEKRRNSYTVYKVAIKMDKGEMRTLTVSSIEGLREGKKVEIRDGRVTPA